MQTRGHGDAETRGNTASRLLIVALATIAVIVVGSTWRVFSQTVDEPAHIAAGMQWLATGDYTLDLKHPPLARILFALGPRLRGIPFAEVGGVHERGNEVLYHGGRYSSNLSLARAGNLPFLILAVMVVAAWSRRLNGPWAAVLSVLLFVTLPPILGHTGVATTDLAVAATIAASLYGFVLWLEAPTIKRSILLGLALAGALLSKFSAIAFLPAAMIVAFVCHLLGRGAKSAKRRAIVVSLLALLSSLIVCVWAAFRFSAGPLFPTENPNVYDDAFRPSIRRVLHAVGDHGLFPAPEMFQGFAAVLHHDQRGHFAYLMGETSREGWWFYFPVALALKTPLPFLILALGAIAQRSCRGAIPLAAALSILGVSMTSSINIGIRHVLPIYPLLAISAGGVAAWLLRQKRLLPRAVAVILIGWQLAGTARGHPDHLAWFNEIAGDRPEAWLLDSNLDWGQDLLRLSREVRKRKIDSLALGYFGTAIPERHKLPPLRHADAVTPADGWVAVSLMNRMGMGGLGKDAYRWLEGHSYTRIGKSILLYHLPAD